MVLDPEFANSNTKGVWERTRLHGHQNCEEELTLGAENWIMKADLINQVFYSHGHHTYIYGGEILLKAFAAGS